MSQLFLKIHKIATHMAVWSVFAAVIVFFLNQLDFFTRSLAYTYSWQLPDLILYPVAMIAFGSTVISLVLSLYRLATKD